MGVAANKALAKLASQHAKPQHAKPPHAKPPRACGGLWAAISADEITEVLREAPVSRAPGLSEVQRAALVEAVRAGGRHVAEAEEVSLLDVQRLQAALEGEQLARLLGGGGTSQLPAAVHRKATALWHFCRGQVAGAETVCERPPPRQLSVATSFTVP